jgi:AraC-like DNA-binding protein
MSSVLYLTDKQNAEVLSSPENFLFKFVLVERGKGCCKVGDCILQSAPGNVILITPNEVCDLTGLKDTTRWIVSFDADTLISAQIDVKEFLMLLGGLPLLSFWVPKGGETEPFQRQFHVDSKNRTRWLNRLWQLEMELRERPFGYAEAMQSLLKLLFFDIVRLAEPHLKQNSFRCCPLLLKVFDFIEENYHDSIGLSEVAKAVDRSPAYLTDFVRRKTGKTVLSWIIEYRMANARQLLLYTNQSINQIAESVGYFDRRHFSRQFLRFHDTTPQLWRQENRTGAIQQPSARNIVQNNIGNPNYAYSSAAFAGI